MIKVLVAILLLCTAVLRLVPQNGPDTFIEDVAADVLAQLADESGDDVDFSMYYDDLLALAGSPINLNEATQEQLKALFFLSDMQIENILYYIYQYGTIKTIYELRLIDGLGDKDIRRMLPFVRIEEPAYKKAPKIYLRDIAKYGKNNLYLRLDRNMPKAKGYTADAGNGGGAEDEGGKKYQGSPFYHSLKYQFQYRSRVLFGLTAEKDAGEPFFTDKKGYDFFSGYVQLNDIGRFKTIVLGDYRADFGEGLVLRTSFSLGKSAQALNLNQPKAGLRKYSSTDEGRFFRGAGAVVRLRKFDAAVFYSNKMIDGDTAGGVFPGIYKTGLHRTQNEMGKKHTVNQQAAGGNITFTQLWYQVGFTVVHTKLDHSLQPEEALYNAPYFKGTAQTTAGIHYRTRWQKLNIFGEAAAADNAALAAVTGLSFKPMSRAGFAALFRYYSPHYDTFYAGAFGTGTSRTGNEKGCYIGTEIYPAKRWKVSAYADSYQFPWLKYGASSPSLGSDYMLNVEFTPNRSLWMYWRMNYKNKEVDFTRPAGPAAQLIPHKKTALRFGLVFTCGNFRWQTLLNGNLVRKADSELTHGVSAVQDITYSFRKIPLRLDFRFQFFDAVDYENRIYTYERDILYAFSIPMYYGLGSRCYLNLKYDVRKDISLWLKAAQTVYADDREKTGTGSGETAGCKRTTVRLLLRWKF